MKNIKLSARLAAVASFVPEGARLIDVGTDHAYVPISLILSGKTDHAWASDINEGPLRSAAENARAHGVEDRLTLYLSNGLRQCCCTQNAYDCIVIAGMGGELISSIISEEKYIAIARPKLILQPMTMQYHLRSFLCENGYEISDETVVFDEGKYYNVIVAWFTGERCGMTEAELMFGKNILEGATVDPVILGYLRGQIGILMKIIEGKKKGRVDCRSEESMLECLISLVGGIRNDNQ